MIVALKIGEELPVIDLGWAKRHKHLDIVDVLPMRGGTWDTPPEKTGAQYRDFLFLLVNTSTKTDQQISDFRWFIRSPRLDGGGQEVEKSDWYLDISLVPNAWINAARKTVISDNGALRRLRQNYDMTAVNDFTLANMVSLANFANACRRKSDGAILSAVYV